MNSQDILEAAIQKALDRGWQPGVVTTGSSKDRARYVVKRPGQLYEILFNHDFARALWGEEELYCQPCGRRHEGYGDCDMGTGNSQPAYLFHLQQMVIADDPIRYLGENL